VKIEDILLDKGKRCFFIHYHIVEHYHDLLQHCIDGSSCQKDGIVDHQKSRTCHEIYRAAFINEKVETLGNS